MSPSLKLILAIVVVAALGFFGYQYISGTSESDDLTKIGVSDTSKMGAQVLSALNQLQQLKLDGSVFSDKTFKSLKDFSRPIPGESVGRANPFAPIGAEPSQTKTTASGNASSTFSVFKNPSSNSTTSTTTGKMTKPNVTTGN